MPRDLSKMFADMDEYVGEPARPAIVNLPAQWAVDEAIRQIEIARATIDVIIDAKEQTDIYAVAIALEGVSFTLTDVITRLTDAVTGDE